MLASHCNPPPRPRKDHLRESISTRPPSNLDQIAPFSLFSHCNLQAAHPSLFRPFAGLHYIATRDITIYVVAVVFALVSSSFFPHQSHGVCSGRRCTLVVPFPPLRSHYLCCAVVIPFVFLFYTLLHPGPPRQPVGTRRARDLRPRTIRDNMGLP